MRRWGLQSVRSNREKAIENSTEKREMDLRRKDREKLFTSLPTGSLHSRQSDVISSVIHSSFQRRSLGRGYQSPLHSPTTALYHVACARFRIEKLGPLAYLSIPEINSISLSMLHLTEGAAMTPDLLYRLHHLVSVSCEQLNNQHYVSSRVWLGTKH